MQKRSTSQDVNIRTGVVAAAVVKTLPEETKIHYAWLSGQVIRHWCGQRRENGNGRNWRRDRNSKSFLPNFDHKDTLVEPKEGARWVRLEGCIIND